MKTSIRLYLTNSGSDRLRLFQSQGQYTKISKRFDRKNQLYAECFDYDDPFLADFDSESYTAYVTLRIPLYNPKSFVIDGTYNRPGDIRLTATKLNEIIGEGFGLHSIPVQNISAVGPCWAKVDQQFRALLSDPTIQPDENWECRQNVVQVDEAVLVKMKEIVDSAIDILKKAIKEHNQ